MIIQALIATLFLGVPDVSRRTQAVRVVDMSDSSYDCTQACTVPADEIRDRECIQRAIDAVTGSPGGPYSAVELPSGYCTIDGPLTVDSVWGFEMYGRGVNATQIVWASASVTNIIELYDVRQANIHDFSIYVTSTDADAAIAAFNGSGVTVSPTANRFHDLFISASGASIADGIRFDDTGAGGDNNQEFYSIERVHVGGYTANAFNIMGGQMKGMHFSDSTCASDPLAPASTCVTSYGCFDWQGGGGGANTYYDFALMNNSCPYVIENGNFEASAKFLYTPGPVGAQTHVTVTGTRWSSIGGVARGAAGATRKVINYNFSGGLTLIGNTFGDDGTGSYTMTANTGTDVITLGGSPDLVVDTPVYFTTSGGLPAPLVANTTYYVKTAPSSTTATLAATVGGATIDITTAGTGTHTAVISNFRPLAFYLYGGDTNGGSYVLVNNYIGTNLTGTDLFPSRTPVLTNNTVPVTTYSGGLIGTSQPLVRPDGIVNAADFGVIVDDSGDDTSALQAAIDAACDGCAVRLPSGTLKVSAGITISKSLSLIGDGAPLSSTNQPFGGGGWAGDAETGTIIEASQTSGSVISADGNFRLRIENIGIKGTAGSGTATGFTLGGSYSPRLSLKNVSAYNLATGFSIVNAQDGHIDGLQARGCTTGLYVGENANSNVWTATDIGVCGTGILVYSNSQNLFDGGTVQGHTGYGLRSLGGAENTYKNIYFESSNGSALAMSLESPIGKGDIVFTASSATDRLTTAEAHGWAVGDAVQVRTFGGSLPTASGGGLAASTTYYVQSVPTSTTLTLARTNGGALIDLTSNGSGRMFVGHNGIVAGDLNEVDRCHFGDVGDGVVVWTNGNRLDLTSAVTSLTFKSASSNNVAKSVGTITSYTDEGSGNTRIASGTTASETRYVTPFATTETGQSFTLDGWSNFLALKSTANWFGIELRDDVGYVRFLDAANNVSMVDYHPNAIPASRYSLFPALVEFGTGIQADTVSEYTGSAGVDVQHAKFTGTATSDSTLAVSGITADDSGSVFIGFDGAGGTITAQATTFALGATNLTTSGTVDGVDVSDLGLIYNNTADQEIVAGGTGIQAFTNAGVALSIPGGTLQANDRVHVHAVWKVTNRVTMTNMVPNVYWGGASGGTALFTTAYVLSATTGLVVTGDAYLVYRTVGGSPVWSFTSEWRSSTNNSYTSYVSSFGATSQPTNADIAIEATVQMTGTVDAADKTKLYDLSVRVERQP